MKIREEGHGPPCRRPLCEPTFQQISSLQQFFSYFALMIQRKCSKGIMISFCVIAALRQDWNQYEVKSAVLQAELWNTMQKNPIRHKMIGCDTTFINNLSVIKINRAVKYMHNYFKLLLNPFTGWDSTFWTD